METALAFVGVAVAIAAGYYLVFVLPERRSRAHLAAATAGWDLVARELGAPLQRHAQRVVIDAVVDGRPVLVEAAAGEFKSSRQGDPSWSGGYTKITTHARHPDDVHDDAPPPAPTGDAWDSAWASAEIRAEMRELRRPALGRSPRHELRVPDVLDAAMVVGQVRAQLDELAAGEREVRRWQAAARAIGLRSTAAFVADGEVRGCAVRLVIDTVERGVMLRATGVTRGAPDVVAIGRDAPPAGYEDHAAVELGLPAPFVARGAARLTDAARAAIVAADPVYVIGEQAYATVSLRGLVPDEDRWRAAVTLVVELVAAPGDGALR